MERIRDPLILRTRLNTPHLLRRHIKLLQHFELHRLRLRNPRTHLPPHISRNSRRMLRRVQTIALTGQVLRGLDHVLLFLLVFYLGFFLLHLVEVLVAAGVGVVHFRRVLWLV